MYHPLHIVSSAKVKLNEMVEFCCKVKRIIQILLARTPCNLKGDACQKLCNRSCFQSCQHQRRVTVAAVSAWHRRRSAEEFGLG